MALSGRTLSLLTGFGIAAVLLGVYTAAPARFLSNDTRPAVYSAISLVKRGDLDLDEFSWTIRGQNPEWPYYVVPTVDGRVVSRYGIGGPVTAAPVFGAALAVRPRISETTGMWLGRFAAGLCVALAALFVWLAALRVGASRKGASLVALVYGLGTCAFSLASQALWQHGPAQMWLALGAYLLVRAGPWSVPGAGAAFAAAVLCRTPDAVLALAATIYVLGAYRREPRRWLGFIAAALAVASLQAVHSWVYFGAPWVMGQAMARTDVHHLHWHEPFWRGFLGLLVSPSRGLLVYSPVFLFLLYRPVATWRASHPAVRALLLGGIALVLVMSRYSGWTGGACFGYRMICDAAPFLALAMVAVLPRLSSWARAAFAAALALSVTIHSVGAFNYSPTQWDAVDVEVHPEAVWSVRHGQLSHVFTHRMVSEPLSAFGASPGP